MNRKQKAEPLMVRAATWTEGYFTHATMLHAPLIFHMMTCCLYIMLHHLHGVLRVAGRFVKPPNARDGPALLVDCSQSSRFTGEG